MSFSGKTHDILYTRYWYSRTEVKLILTWDSSHLVDKMSNCNNVCLYKHIQEFSSHHICSNCDLKMNKKINRVTKICEIKNFQHSVLSYLGPVPHRLDSFHVIYAFLIPSNINTGKSFSEALILPSINPEFDKRLFIELWAQYMKISSSEYGENMFCTQIVFCFCFDIHINICTSGCKY